MRGAEEGAASVRLGRKDSLTAPACCQRTQTITVSADGFLEAVPRAVGKLACIWAAPMIATDAAACCLHLNSSTSCTLIALGLESVPTCTSSYHITAPATK